MLELKTPIKGTNITFESQLCELISKHKLDSIYNVRDFTLAGYIMSSLISLEMLQSDTTQDSCGCK